MKWSDVIPEARQLSEARSTRVRANNRVVTIWINPLYSEIVALLRRFPHGLRALASYDQLFVWDALKAIHWQVEEELEAVVEMPRTVVRMIIGASDESLDSDVYDGWEADHSGLVPDASAQIAWKALDDVAEFPSVQRAVTPPVRSTGNLISSETNYS